MKYNTERIIARINCIIGWIGLALVFVNFFTDNPRVENILTGFIYGLDTMIILMSVVLFIIINHNFKIEIRQFNKEMGYREDFDLMHRFHLIKRVGDYEVSTVDLGLDHSFGVGEPLYYETMIFKRKESEENPFKYYQERYATKKEAKKGHKKAIKYVKKEINK